MIINLKNLPLHVLLNVYKYCDYDTLKNIKKIHKKLFDEYLKNEYILKKINHKREKLVNYGFNEYFLKYIDDDIILKLKRVDFEYIVGSTSYIDYIIPSHFNKTPYIYGLDIYGRFFFSVLLDIYHNNIKYKTPLTIFQRYSDMKDLLFSCGGIFNYVEKINIDRDNLETNKFLNNFVYLLKNKYYENTNSNILDEIDSFYLNISYSVSNV